MIDEVNAATASKSDENRINIVAKSETAILPNHAKMRGYSFSSARRPFNADSVDDFESYLNEIKKITFSTCKKLGASDADADDITGKVCARAISDEKKKRRRWNADILRAIARNAYVDNWRQRGTLAQPYTISDQEWLSVPNQNPSIDPFEVSAQNQKNTQLRLTVNQLPEKQRMVVNLCYYEGYSGEEISQMISCPLGTVRSRLHYALKNLRRLLPPDFYET